MASPRCVLEVLSILILAVAPFAPAAGQGWIEPGRPLPPSPMPRGGIVKIRSAVQVAVTDRVARVSVEEWFRNDGVLLDRKSVV